MAPPPMRHSTWKRAPEVWLDLNGDGIQDEAVPYDLQATRASGEMVALTDALAVGQGQGAVVAVTLTGPGVVRPDRNYLYQVNYTNAGDVDAQMPLLMLTSENQTPMGLDLDLLTVSGSMQTVGIQRRLFGNVAAGGNSPHTDLLSLLDRICRLPRRGNHQREQRSGRLGLDL